MKTNKLYLGCILSTFLFAGCSGMSGTYVAGGSAFFEKLNFTSGDKVEITFHGVTKEGTYEKDGDKIVVTAGGDNCIFTVDENGCIDGGGRVGKYCKE